MVKKLSKKKCNPKKELRLGTLIEMEHTKIKNVAMKIAKDHIKEFDCYYSKGLIPMEKRLRRKQ